MKATSLLAALALLSLPAAHAGDWLHYRGPAMNGTTTEKLPATLPTEPKQLWKRAVGTGVSSVAVSGERVFTMGNVNEHDVIYCLDAATGADVWTHKFPLPLDPKNFEGGPRSTPTVDGSRVYTLSHSGDLWCLDAATGKPVWNKHLMQGFGGRRPDWGYAGSPTIEGNLVLLDSGGAGASTLALDKATGATVWKSGDDGAGYGSVIVSTIGGRRTALVFKAKALVGYDVKDGRELWRSRWKTSYDVNAVSPLVVGDRVLVSSGYGTGASFVEISGSAAREKWTSKALRAHFNTPVSWQGHLYGIDGDHGPQGQLACLDAATGGEKWKAPVGGGALICADGKLIVFSEKGELIIADAAPSGFKALARWQALGGHCWVQPVLAHGRIYCRNNAGELVSLELK